MLSWVNDVERTKHAAARLEYHHSSGVQTIIAHARDLQDIRERWAVPTFMDDSEPTPRPAVNSWPGSYGYVLNWNRKYNNTTHRLRIFPRPPWGAPRRVHSSHIALHRVVADEVVCVGPPPPNSVLVGKSYEVQ